MATRSSITSDQPDIDETPVEAALVLMRAEWRNGTVGRYLDRIQKAIAHLEALAPAQQTADALKSISAELLGYRSNPVVERQEQLKRTAERLKAIAPQLRQDHPPFGPIGKNPVALRVAKRSRPTAAHSVLRPDEPVAKLAGVGTAVANRLEQLKIHTIEDLLHHTPRHHIDFSRPQSIGQVGSLYGADNVTLGGRITELKTIPGKQRNRVEARISDGTGWARITWFNPFVAKQLAVGDEIVVHGAIDPFRGGLSLTGPEWERRDSPTLARSRLIPVYALTQGLGQKQMRRLTRLAIDETRQTLADPVPASILSDFELVGLPFAIDQRHYPANHEMLADAIRRLAFDDLFYLQIGLIQRKRANEILRGNSLEAGATALPGFVAGLSFDLTKAQRDAVNDVSKDLSSSRVMQRLVQGDVGSGKTVVAAAAALQATRSGYQTAVMAPTEILAAQLHFTFTELYARLGDDAPRISLLTGSTRKRDRAEMLDRLVNGEIDILVGTHAVIQEGVVFDRLGLTIVDEQHRFGVRQRGELPSRGAVGPAHVLTMSATPIPRSLNMVLLGDVDVSVIDEMPPGREPVITRRYFGDERNAAYELLRAEVASGRQAFVICPLVEDSELTEMRSAVAESKRLQRDVFPEFKIALLHGRMSGAEKNRIMTSFKAREFDILVATSVIEVGIDVPNATVMMVEGADRFGLAQLHQFRGRVGRGGGASYCLLLADDTSPMGEERLKMMESTTDGFVLAEADLRMRGPGDFLGTRQSGLPELSMLRSGFDSRVLDQARRAATTILDVDQDLSRPEHLALRNRVRQFWASAVSDLAGA
jgi:ATP-dependent DNA helicase RecG